VAVGVGAGEGVAEGVGVPSGVSLAIAAAGAAVAVAVTLGDGTAWPQPALVMSSRVDTATRPGRDIRSLQSLPSGERRCRVGGPRKDAMP
jgi:hypothetical protein